jgi:hypothetical protein
MQFEAALQVPGTTAAAVHRVATTSGYRSIRIEANTLTVGIMIRTGQAC